MGTRPPVRHCNLEDCQSPTLAARVEGGAPGLSSMRVKNYSYFCFDAYFFWGVHETRVTVLPSDHSQYCLPSSPTQVLHQLPSDCFIQTEQLGAAKANAPKSMVIARTAPNNNFLRLISPSSTRWSASSKRSAAKRNECLAIAQSLHMPPQLSMTGITRIMVTGLYRFLASNQMPVLVEMMSEPSGRFDGQYSPI